MLGVIFHMIYKGIIGVTNETDSGLTEECDKTVVKLTNDHGVTVRKIHNLFGLNEFECMRTSLLRITDPCRKRTPSCGKLKEILIFGNDTDYYSYYALVDVSNDYKIIDHDKFTKLLIIYSAEILPLKDDRDELIKIFAEPFIQMLEILCKHTRKSGKVEFRASVKLFIGNYGTTQHNLGWHYDFGGKSTITVELINDFSENGSLMFAKNRYKNCSGKCGCNTKEIDVIDDTVMTVTYEPNCGILFDGYRGAQIHKPVDVQTPKIKTGESNMRAVIQVVIRDDDWMNAK